jgi:hypothetical protein
MFWAVSGGCYCPEYVCLNFNWYASGEKVFGGLWSLLGSKVAPGCRGYCSVFFEKIAFPMVFIWFKFRGRGDGAQATCFCPSTTNDFPSQKHDQDKGIGLGAE